MRTRFVAIMALGITSCRAIVDSKTNFPAKAFEKVQLLPQVSRPDDRIPIEGLPLNRIYLAEEKNFPLYAGDAAWICDSQKFYNAKGELSRGTKNCKPCTEDGQVDCLTTRVAPAFLATNLAKKIAVGDAIANIKGERIVSVAAIPPSCTANAVVGCVTTATYKSADWTNVTAANIKNGVVVAGLTGTYPSSGNLLTGASAAADLNLTTFDAKIKSASTFEWFGPNGARYQVAGNSDLTAGNIKSGVALFGVTGDYPSATYPLASNTAATDLTLFTTQLSTDGNFEFFDSAGVKYTGSGDSDLVAANVKNGVAFENLSITGTYCPDDSQTFTYTGANQISTSPAGCNPIVGNDALGRSFADGSVAENCQQYSVTKSNLSDGIYNIDPDGTTGPTPRFKVYCNMKTNGGGWTMVLAQFEADQMTDWNEGLQVDYDPSLVSGKSFALNTAQLPPHSEMSAGRGLQPNFITSFVYVYSSGNIEKTSLSGSDGQNYWIHRNTSNYYHYNNPDSTLIDNPRWNNTLTIEGYSGSYTQDFDHTWSYGPASGSNKFYERGFGMLGFNQYTVETYAWTIWVR